ncbi:MAG: hypothetical protein IJW49_11115 [Clostridia bacterium]|nr:hypothetical protein [Clostridia bacterium]
MKEKGKKQSPKNIIKRLILLGVTASLLFGCFFFHTSVNGAHIAGKGKGANLEVNSINELYNVLMRLGSQNSKKSLFSDPSENFVTVLSNNDTLIAKNNEQNPYLSATITIISTAHSDIGTQTGHSKSDLNREMTMYATEYVTFYESRGYVSSSSSSSSYRSSDTSSTTTHNSNQQNFVFDMDILLMNDKAYINIQEFITIEESYRSTNTTTREYYDASTGEYHSSKYDNYSKDASKSIQIKPEYTNQWIEMPLEFLEVLTDVDALNRSAMSTIGGMVDLIVESGEIVDEQRISLNQHDFARIYEKVSGEGINDRLGEGTLNFQADLTVPDNPFISYLFANTISNENGTSSSNANETFGITNINNTEISFDPSLVSIVVTDELSFKNLFIIEERNIENGNTP